MNIASIMTTAQKMGINPQKINQAMQMANKYGIVQDGEITGDLSVAKQIIAENGGSGTLDKALKMANNPLIKMGLSKMGIDGATLDGAIKEVRGVTGKNIVPEINTNTNINPFNDRLSKLR